MQLDDIPLQERRQYMEGFITQTQADLDKTREQLAAAQRHLAEATLRHEAFKAAHLDTTMTENAIKAKESAVALLQHDIGRLEKELAAFQKFQASFPPLIAAPGVP